MRTALDLEAIERALALASKNDAKSFYGDESYRGDWASEHGDALISAIRQRDARIAEQDESMKTLAGETVRAAVTLRKERERNAELERSLADQMTQEAQVEGLYEPARFAEMHKALLSKDEAISALSQEKTELLEALRNDMRQCRMCCIDVRGYCYQHEHAGEVLKAHGGEQ